MNKSSNSSAFSLIEVTIALGVTAVSLIAIFALLPIGAQTNRNAISQTAAISILSAVTADMRATPDGLSTTGQYHITFGTAQTLYFDELGNFTSASSTSTSTYRLDVAFPPTSGLTRAPTNVKLSLTWPAQADPVNAAGKAQLFASFDRH